MTAAPGPQQPDEVEARDPYGHSEADHAAAGVCRRPSMKARKAVAPYAVLGKDWQRAWMVGWDAARAELVGQLGQACGSCGGRGGVHTRRCPAAPGPQQPDDEAAAVARAEERTAQVWDPCESDDNYDDARMELYLAFAAEERRAALAQSYEDDLGITPGTAVEARLLDIARELAGFPAAPGPQQPDEVRLIPTPAEIEGDGSPWDALYPAAPSAQPDECRRLTGFDGPCTCTPWRGPGFHEVGCPRYPAQPVRDTEEGRR